MNRAYKAALIAAAVALAGGLLFEVVLQVADPEDWWQDAGFYGAVSAGATAAVFFKLAMREVPVEETELC